MKSVQSPSKRTLVLPTVVPSSSASDTFSEAAASRILFFGFATLKSFQASFRLALVWDNVVVCILCQFKFVVDSFWLYLADNNQLVRIWIFTDFDRVVESLLKRF